MKINNKMNLSDLAERMGFETGEVDYESVRTMRSLLVEAFPEKDTSEIDEKEWLRLLDRSQQY